MENSIPLDHDLHMSYDDIKAISEITWKHPIDWGHIRKAIEDAIPLIDYMGPDAISYVVDKEKKIRNLPTIPSYDPKCQFNGWEYDDKNMEDIDEPNR